MFPFIQQVPFRVGTTSYIIPDDILPNIRFLAGKVRDVELVLFELDDGQSNLPDAGLIEELNRLAAANDLTYTVHLPLDLRLGAEGDEQHVSLVKARRVIEATRALAPWAYVLHLDGKEVRQGASAQALSRWRDQSVRALEIVAGWAGDPARLAVENLEGYPLQTQPICDFIEPVLARFPASRCMDIGHLWQDGHDPLPYMEAYLARTRVIHLHGIATRDHQSLAHMPRSQRDTVLDYLLAHYQGVLTLEIFGEDDLRTSLAALDESLAGKEGTWKKD
jgi:sugar phosphate isomerase/epimerase